MTEQEIKAERYDRKRSIRRAKEQAELSKALHLGAEYFYHDFAGCVYRRIHETEIDAHLVRVDQPPGVRLSAFRTVEQKNATPRAKEGNWEARK